MFIYLQRARSDSARLQPCPSHSPLYCSVAQRKAAGKAFSAIRVEQRAVHLSWLSGSGRKELDFVLLGREQLLQIREVPLTRKKKSRKKISEPFCWPCILSHQSPGSMPQCYSMGRGLCAWEAWKHDSKSLLCVKLLGWITQRMFLRNFIISCQGEHITEIQGSVCLQTPLIAVNAETLGMAGYCTTHFSLLTSKELRVLGSQELGI